MLWTEKPEEFKPDMEVVGCFCEYDDNIVLLKRHEDSFQPGRWGLPAGKVESGEDLGVAMARELKEETGIDLPPEDLSLLKTVYVEFAGVSFVFNMFRAVLHDKPEVALNAREHIESVWKTPEEALDLDLMEDAAECIELIYTESS